MSDSYFRPNRQPCSTPGCHHQARHRGQYARWCKSCLNRLTRQREELEGRRRFSIRKTPRMVG